MDQLVALLLAYKYFVLMPLAIVEGPIITIIAGFLVSMNLMNPVVVYIIVMIGDWIGDTMYYAIGRYGGDAFVKKFGGFFRITSEKMASAKVYFNTHHRKTIVLSKLIHGIGFTGLIAAGGMKIPYFKYLFLCMLTTFIQAAIFLFVGILFGHAYLQIGKYLDYFAAGTVVLGLLVGLFFVLKKVKFNPKI